ncbi:glycosyltransferase family 4 protein [Kluyvera sichuanensis]|uniref:glycosyltransferase family 4 protein n=1 Tax=Kluyvera sichuanensis TaxID=2725494 RepID=UPI003F67C916
MRIIHVIIDMNVGGAELMLKRLIEHSSNKDVEHIVISLTDLGVLGPELSKSGVIVKCLNIKSPIQYITSLLKMIHLFKELQPDVVHTWMYHSDLLGGIAARISGIKRIIWCVRSTDIRKGGSKFTIFIRWLCAKVSSFVPDSIVYAANASKLVHEECGYNEVKSVVIPNGFDLSYLRQNNFSEFDLRADLGISDNEIVICSIGRYSSVKDHKNFIAAAISVAEKKDNLRFLLVGRGLTKENVSISSQINKSIHADKFILLGERKDVPVCLKASDIFCLHSLTEGFPNVLGEAMAMEVPSVTTDVGDAASLLAMPEYTVPSGQPDALAKALLNLVLLSHDQRKDLGNTLRKRIEADFSMDKVTHKYLALYRN